VPLNLQFFPAIPQAPALKVGDTKSWGHS